MASRRTREGDDGAADSASKVQLINEGDDIKEVDVIASQFDVIKRVDGIASLFDVIKEVDDIASQFDVIKRVDVIASQFDVINRVDIIASSNVDVIKAFDPLRVEVSSETSEFLKSSTVPSFRRGESPETGIPREHSVPHP